MVIVKASAIASSPSFAAEVEMVDYSAPADHC